MPWQGANTAGMWFEYSTLKFHYSWMPPRQSKHVTVRNLLKIVLKHIQPIKPIEMADLHVPRGGIVVYVSEKTNHVVGPLVVRNAREALSENIAG